MKVTLAASTFDILGAVEIDALPTTTDGTSSRRVTRVTTLDGGVAVTDRGYSEGDRVFTFNWKNVSQEQTDAIKRIFILYPRVTIALGTNVYLAAPSIFRPGFDESNAELLSIELLTQEQT